MEKRSFENSARSVVLTCEHAPLVFSRPALLVATHSKRSVVHTCRY